jgi:hypothetical protein
MACRPILAWDKALGPPPLENDERIGRVDVPQEAFLTVPKISE